MIEELNKCIESNKEQMVQSLCEIVGIPSKYGRPKEGAPYGEESRRALGFAMDLGRKLGFETVVNVGDRVCYIEYGTGTKVVGYLPTWISCLKGMDGPIRPLEARSITTGSTAAVP